MPAVAPAWARTRLCWWVCRLTVIREIIETSHLSQGVSDFLQLLESLLVSLGLALLPVEGPPPLLVRQVDQVHLLHTLALGLFGLLGLVEGMHQASEGQQTKLVGGDVLEQLLMTTAPTAKRYMSMIMRGLSHKSACPV